MRTTVVMLVCLVISGCASHHATQHGMTDREIFTERVLLFWEAKQKDDHKAVYELTDPDSRKEVVPGSERTKAIVMSRIISYHIEDMIIDKGSAEVTTKLTVELRHPLLRSPHPVEQTAHDRWVKRSGTWYVMPGPDLKTFLQQYTGEEERR